MGVAYEDYCYPTPEEAQISVASYYRHEHNPQYTQINATLWGSTVKLNHYILQNGTLVEDTSTPAYLLPTCTTPGYLNGLLFDPALMNPIDVADAVGAGFLLIVAPLAVVWAGRRFIRPLFYR